MMPSSTALELRPGHAEWWTLPPPKTDAERYERIANDEVFFLEAFCKVVSYTGSGLEPFTLNTAQRKYLREIWYTDVREDIVGKSRKWGFSTLRLGLGLHNAIYQPGRIFRVVGHRLDTAKALNLIIKTIYESAWNELKRQGLDPAYYLPRIVSDTTLGYTFSTKSQVIVETAAGEGVGQADRTDDLYCTEYSDWRHAEDKFAGLDGSHPPASLHNRTTIDFNAHGKVGDAYVKYEAARLPHEHKDWNGFTPFFAGAQDCPEVYTPEFLATARRKLKGRYPEVYPSNDREMWLASELAVFPLEHLDIAWAKGQTAGYVGKGSAECPVTKFLHGIDPASGRPGGDFQACVSLGLSLSEWIEAAAPIHGHWQEPVFARMCDQRIREFPGPNVVERNVGALVISTMRDLGTPHMYQHRARDKNGQMTAELGFPMSRPSKRIAIGDLQEMLSDGLLGIVTRDLYDELCEYEWKIKEDGSEDEGLAGAPAVKGKNDDLVSGLLMAVEGLHRPQLRVAAA